MEWLQLPKTMRIAIISDVHGDLPYDGCKPCEVIDYMAQESWQGIPVHGRPQVRR